MEWFKRKGCFPQDSFCDFSCLLDLDTYIHTKNFHSKIIAINMYTATNNLNSR